MTDKLGRIVSIPLKSSDTTIKGMLFPMDEGEVKDMVIDDAKRRLTSALSRKLHKE